MNGLSSLHSREQRYYPFGMVMPLRQFSSGSGYRYGFNGKEEDDEVKGNGNQQDYGMRIYDTRLGRFLSVDPISKSYPELTPYQFASNTPIWAVDLDGLEMATYAEAQAYGDVFVRQDLKKKGYSDSQIEENTRHTRNAVVGGSTVGILIGFDLFTGANVTRTGANLFTIWQASQVYEYTNRNSHQTNPQIRQENSKNALGATVDLGVGYGIGKTIGVLTKISLGPGKFVYKSFKSSSIRFSQSSVNGLDDIATSMQKNGWKGDPIDIVKMEDGIYTTVDNTRLLAAQKVGINVKANAHNFDDLIPEEMAKRFIAKDGSLPKTWGEAVKNRVQNQNKQFRTSNENGSFLQPKAK